MQDLSRTFESLAEHWPDYSFRSGQLELASLVQSALENSTTGIFEAGTGTGKTLSYLIPAFLLNRPVIISTGTKNLQDQLFRKDVPILQPLFPDKRVALLKGRANYLCPRRLRMNLQVLKGSPHISSQLMDIRRWSSQSRTGDLTEILDTEENPQLQHLVTSTRDNCLAGKCPDFHECPLYRARERAKQADIIIVNHHLLFSDLGKLDDPIRSILPDVAAIVVDEAHQIPAVARQFFGERLHHGQLVELGKDVRLELALMGNDDSASLGVLARFEEELKRFRTRVFESVEQDFLRWVNSENRGIVLSLDQALADLARQLSSVAERSDGMALCARRALAMADVFALLTEQVEHDGEFVHWIERFEVSYAIHLSPLSIGQTFQAIMDASLVTWIFTSATLSVDGNFEHFKSELGIEQEVSAIFDSPFDYESAIRAYLPSGIPEPGIEAHTRQLVACCIPLIESNAGRTFFLFTSHRALQIAAEGLEVLGRPLLVQGTRSKLQMLASFLDTPGSVLLGTQSFWEGVDVRGADLRLLIIDKLPFPNPSEPLYRAQNAAIQSAGGNGFVELALPRTLLLLKQGFGRLMREEADRGLFVLGDPRLRSRSYRHYVLNNLPRMQWVESAEDASQWLRHL